MQLYFEENIARYSQPVQLSFQHVFANSQDQANRLQTDLQAGSANWRALGQPFMLNREYASLAQADMVQLMGRAFSEALFEQSQLNTWFGPVRSAYGWHLVKLTARSDKKVPRFANMVEKVANDWHVEQAALTQREAWERLRAGYQIEMVPLEAAR